MDKLRREVKVKERKGKERKGKERKGEERKGKERKGKEREAKGKTKACLWFIHFYMVSSLWLAPFFTHPSTFLLCGFDLVESDTVSTLQSWLLL